MATNDLTDYLKGKKPQGFNPHPFYSKEGDYLTYYFRDADFYADRIDDILTLYRTMVGDEIVGFKLKGVKHLVRTLGDFSVEVKTPAEDISLSLLFLAGMGLSDNPQAKSHYQQFGRQTRTVPVRPSELQPV